MKAPERSILAVSVALLFVLVSLPISTLPGPSRAEEASTSSSATARVPWNPATGLSSPGAGHYRLQTISRSFGACTWYGFPPSPVAWLAYDSADKSAWVASPPSCVDVVALNGTYPTITAAVNVGYEPFGVAVDNATDEVFVTNTGSHNVTVISAATDRPIGSVRVGKDPYGVAYDWRSSDVFVADGGSDNVTVISGATLKVVATVAVGQHPLGIAADPQDGEVFVANHGSRNVTVLSDSTDKVLATVGVGKGPYGVGLDTSSDLVFVADEGSNNVSVLDGATNTLRASIPVVGPFMDLQGVAYDSANQTVWVGAGSFYAVELNASNLTVIGYSSSDPSGMMYDPDNGDVCFTNTANATFGCFLSPRRTYATVPLIFSETGLPVGDPWSVLVNESNRPSTRGDSTTRNNSFSVVWWPNVNPDVYNYLIRGTHGYHAVSSRGSIAVGGGTNVVQVFFTRKSTVSVSFHELGLPSGTTWYVNITDQQTGAGFSLAGTSSRLNATLSPDNYTFSVQAIGYTSSHIQPSKGTFGLLDLPFRQAVTFS